MGLDNPIHIAFLLILLLLVFGAKRLPEMGRSLGDGMRGFKDALSGDGAHPAVAQPAPQSLAHPAVAQPAPQPLAQPVVVQPLAQPVLTAEQQAPLATAIDIHAGVRQSAEQLPA
jgi:sec-independent protein translocase protein TatA